MVKEFKFPDVGEGLTEGKLVSWKVKVGEQVSKDQTLAEVETDKAVVEIPSPYEGIISKLHNEEGDTLLVGNVIVTFDGDKDNDRTLNESEKQLSNVEEPKKLQVVTEKIVETEKTKTEIKQEKNESKTILAMPAVRKMARDNHMDLTQIQPTGHSGQITIDDLHNAGEISGQQLASEFIPPKETVIPQTPKPIPVNPIPKLEIKKELTNTTQTEFAIHNTENIGNLLNDSFATPKIRRYARSQGLDIHKIKGSGKHGMITELDIDKVSGIIPKEGVEKSSETGLSVKDIETSQETSITIEDKIMPMSTVRKIIASRMRESLDMVAQVTHVEEVDMTNVFNLRNKEKVAFEKLGVKLTYLPFIVKAALAAVEKFPRFNASIKDENIILKKQYNFGIAVDTPHGLIVPVIRNVNKKSIIEISKEIVILAKQAREKRIAPKDIVGSTFSITSVGNLGGISFTPIINYPESAILGVAKIRDEPRIINNHIYARKIMNLCLTFDHRIVDGADAARFTSLIKEYLEDPQRLFMERI